MNLITVSVFLLTYNQEDCIQQTIDSILSQETDFDFQLVIGEDYSTDNTRKICELYANEYPDKVNLLPSAGKNLGLIKNYLRTIKECTGKYIAICDGDDYWTDPLKLQKQVDFLEKHPECKIVYTNYKKMYPDGSLKVGISTAVKDFTNFDKLVKMNFIPSVTAMFVNMQGIDKLPEWIHKYPYGDWPTYLWTLKDNGLIGYISEETAVYRMDIGTSFKLLEKNSRFLKVNIGILEDMLSDNSFIHNHKAIEISLVSHKRDLMASYIRENKYVKSKQSLFDLIKVKDQKMASLKLFAYSLLKKMKSKK